MPELVKGWFSTTESGGILHVGAHWVSRGFYFQNSQPTGRLEYSNITPRAAGYPGIGPVQIVRLTFFELGSAPASMRTQIVKMR